MEYIKKEDLIIGEVYTHENGNICRCDQITNIYIIGKHLGSDKRAFRKPPQNPGYFEIGKMKLATTEEKHWLNECIKLNKFITFEEAMKTFIPEYVECINKYGYCKIGEIYDTKDDNLAKSKCILSWYQILVTYPNLNTRFKPSTKEAYDAQFVVKEPEFVLPEKWCVKTTLSNKNILQDYLQNNIINYPEYLKTWEVINDRYFHNKEHGYGEGHSSYKIFDGFIEITFEQFEKYVLKEEIIEEKIIEEKVIEPLPQFKVIETIETITKVENNEGNQFFIGDVVKSLSNVIYNITKFEYNEYKTQIIAILNETSRFDINQIEHYIEPKTDYKILEYKTEGGISCKAPFLADSHQFYINERCKIYSIKRISDDLIITVGDEVLSKTCGVPNKILSIELINNKIRLYPRNSFYNLEDIIKVKEETLLEKAKRLYPIGTKFIACNTSEECIITTGIFQQDSMGYEFINEIDNTGNDIQTKYIYHCIYSKDKWAKIIE